MNTTERSVVLEDIKKWAESTNPKKKKVKETHSEHDAAAGHGAMSKESIIIKDIKDWAKWRLK